MLFWVCYFYNIVKKIFFFLYFIYYSNSIASTIISSHNTKSSSSNDIHLFQIINQLLSKCYNWIKKTDYTNLNTILCRILSINFGPNSPYTYKLDVSQWDISDIGHLKFMNKKKNIQYPEINLQLGIILSNHLEID